MARGSKRNLFHRWTDERVEPIWVRPEVIAGLIALLCYINTPLNSFTDDGIPLVQLSQLVVEPGRWADIWVLDVWYEAADATPLRDKLYRPWAITSYRLVHKLFDPPGMVRAFPQLAANVLLHVLITVLVVRLCRHAKGDYAAALAAGALFAALPIHTEVINNAVGRADLLAVLGVAASLLLHRRSMIATTDMAIIKWRVASAVAVFSAMAAKESGVTAPFLIILFDKLWYQPWRAASRDRTWWNPRSLLRFSYLLVPVGVYLALRTIAFGGTLEQNAPLTKTINVLVEAPAWQHVLGVFQLWGMYWAKTIWPAVLTVNYSLNAVRLPTSLLNGHVLIGMGVTIALVTASILAWRRGVRSVAFLAAAIIIAYAPTSNSFHLIQIFFAERIWYLPSVWVCVLLGLAASPFVRRPVWFTVGILVIFAMTARCLVRNAQWRDNRTLYAAAYETHRSGIGALRLHGRELVNQGIIRNDRHLVERGIQILRQAVEIDQGFTDAQRTLGAAYLEIGDYENAVHHLQIANMQIPGHDHTEEALARARRMLTEAQKDLLAHARERVESDPADVDAELRLIRILRKLDHLPEALQRFQEQEARFAGSADWQTEYAITLVYANRLDEAIERYRRALALAPDRVPLIVELSMLLLERREGSDLQDAWDLSGRALKLAPSSPIALVARAELLALKGNIAAAYELYNRAIQLLPPGDEQRRILEKRARIHGP